MRSIEQGAAPTAVVRVKLARSSDASGCGTLASCTVRPDSGARRCATLSGDGLPRCRKRDLAQWVPTVDEESATGNDRLREPVKGAPAGRRMTTVQGADPHREREVVRMLIGGEYEVFAGNGANTEHAGRDEITGRPDELLDRCG